MTTAALEANEFIVGGHDPYVVAWYSVPSPALADGHVYYASTNGKIYCFGTDFPTDDTDGDGVIDYRDNCPQYRMVQWGTCTVAVGSCQSRNNTVNAGLEVLQYGSGRCRW